VSRIPSTNGALIRNKAKALPERGNCLARKRLPLSAREAESRETNAEQREHGGFGDTLHIHGNATELAQCVRNASGLGPILRALAG
jgi:hypothetical protein